jgi:preprotein translocase subunit SecG
MDMLFSFILIVHVIVAVAIIVLVLLQHGKGADMGAAFGSGSSGSLFGATGSANFLSRTTAVLATVFFLSSLALTYVATKRTTSVSSGVMGNVKDAPVSPAPAKSDDAAKTDAPKAEAAKDGAPAEKADAGAGKGNEVPK